MGVKFRFGPSLKGEWVSIIFDMVVLQTEFIEHDVDVIAFGGRLVDVS